MRKTTKKVIISVCLLLCSLCMVLGVAFNANIETSAAETSPLTSINFTRTRTDAANSIKYLEIVFNSSNTGSGNTTTTVIVNGEEATATLTSGEATTTFTIENPKGWSQSTAASFYVTIPAGTVFGNGDVLAADSNWTIVQGAAMGTSGNWIIGACTGKAAADAGTTALNSISFTRTIIPGKNRLDIQFAMSKSITHAQTITTDIVVNGESVKGELTVSGTTATLYVINPKGWSQSSGTAFYVEIPKTLVFHDGSVASAASAWTIVQGSAMAQSGNYVQAACTGKAVSAASPTVLNEVTFTRTRTNPQKTTTYLEIQIKANRTLTGNAVNAYINVNGGEELASISVSGDIVTFTLTNPTCWTEANGSEFVVTIPKNTVLPDGGYISEETMYLIEQKSDLTLNAAGTWYMSTATGTKLTAPVVEFAWNGTPVTEVTAESGDSASLLTVTPAGATITWSEGAVVSGTLVTGTHTATAVYTNEYGLTGTSVITVNVIGEVFVLNSMESLSWAGHNVASGILYNQFVPAVSYTGYPESVTADVYVNGVKTTSAINNDGGKWQFAISVPGIEAANGNAYHVTIPAGTVFPDGTILGEDEHWLSVCNNASGNGYVRVKLTQADTQIAPTYCVDGNGTNLQMVFTNPILASVHNNQNIKVTVTINGESVNGVIADNGDGSGVTFIFDGYVQSAASSTLNMIIPAGTAFYNGTYLADDYYVELTPGSGRYTIKANPAAPAIDGFAWNGSSVTEVNATEGDSASLLTVTPIDAAITWSDGAVVDGKLTVGIHTATATCTDSFGRTATKEIKVNVAEKIIAYNSMTSLSWAGHNVASGILYNQFVPAVSYTGYPASVTVDVYVNGVKTTSAINNDGGKWQFAISVPGIEAANGNAYHVTIPAGTVFPDGTILESEEHWLSVCNNASGNGYVKVKLTQADTQIAPTYCVDGSGTKLQMVFTNPILASVHNNQNIKVTVTINGESVNGVIADNGDGSGVTFIFDGYVQSAASSTLDIVIPAGTAFYNGTYFAEDYKVRLTPGSGRYAITLNPSATVPTFSWNGSAAIEVNAVEGDFASLLSVTPAGATLTWSDGAVVDGKLTVGIHTATATYTDGFGQIGSAEITVSVVEKNYTSITGCTWMGHHASNDIVYVQVMTEAANKWTGATATFTATVNGVSVSATIVCDYDASNTNARWQIQLAMTPDRTTEGATVDVIIPAGTVFPDGTVLRNDVRYIGTNKDTSASQGNYTIQNIEKPTLTLEWIGGEITAGSDASKLVATLTGSTVQDGDKATVTWSDGAVVDGKLVKGTHTVTATYTDSYGQTVTETITVEVMMGVTSFEMGIGAWVRADGDGMRFEAHMSAEDYQLLISQGAKFGMVIIPRDYITEGYELTLENLFGANAKYSETAAAGMGAVRRMMLFDDITPRLSGDKYVYYGGIYGLLTSNITREFVALAFVNVNGEYALASFVDGDMDNTARSMYYVTQCAIDANHPLADTVKEKYIDTYEAYLNGRVYNITYTVKYVYQNYTSIEIVESTSTGALNSTVTITANGAKDGFVLASSETLTQKLYANKENVFEFVYKVENFVGIDVSTWVLSPLNGADDAMIATVARQLKEAGITTANLTWTGAYANTTDGVARFKTLINGLYAEGIKSVVCFHNSGATESETYTAIPDFSMCAGLVGILVWDEPTTATIGRVGEYATMFEQVYTGKEVTFMANLLPSYAASDRIGSDFKAYIESYCTTVLSQVSGEKWLSLDTYPIMKDKTLGDTFLYDIATLKLYSEKYGTVSHVALQSSGWNEGSDEKSVAPTEAQMRFQVYTALAMGVDSYSWFSYGPVNADTLVGQSPAENATVYNALKNVNAEISMFGDIYKSYDWKGSIINKGNYNIFSGEANNDKKALAKVLDDGAFDAYLLDASDTDFSSVSSKQNFVMGVMENEEGKNAYVISNYSSTKANKVATITLTTDSAKNFVVYINGEAEAITVNGSYTLTLAVGEGAFIVES